ncbi:hypothetical protein ACROAE_19810 [Shewanella sp. MF05960]|uniref:hypothetical protein n=1 Tax=Shewanella sp. MF05960 TaxID=3434874 RepID=UPI003D7BF108
MDIRNCSIKFRCPMSWDTLVKTENKLIRYCKECDRGVHFCNNEHELLIAMRNDWCVAIDAEEDDSKFALMGSISLRFLDNIE